MTREEIAARVYCALIGSPTLQVDGRPWNSDTDFPEIASVAVDAADALLEALKKEENLTQS